MAGQFGSLCWSSSEKNLLYIAERKKPKSVSYFDSKPKKEVVEDGEKPVKVKIHSVVIISYVTGTLLYSRL